MDQEVINIRETDQIKCSNCNKQLLIIHGHKAGADLLYKLSVRCPFCGDKSFDFDVCGPMKYVPANGVVITSFAEKDNKCVFTTTKG